MIGDWSDVKVIHVPVVLDLYRWYNNYGENRIIFANNGIGGTKDPKGKLYDIPL